ncbi:MAG: PadR family transcriptional regulator [Deltaproteobacteria bacterium]|nr:PadR family transcriptional regulator [Deltaproteobacteria bacterium]
MKENKSKYAILGILSLGPMSGYDIKKMFQKSVAKFWNESYGQIYPLLKMLVDDGFAIRSIEKQVGKPDRHVYSLTGKGREELQRWLIEPVERQIGRIEIALKLFFGRQVSLPDNIRQVEHFREIQHRELEELKALEERVKEEKAGNPNLAYWLMTVNYGLHITSALIQWCDETLSAMNKLTAKTKKGIKKGNKKELSR